MKLYIARHGEAGNAPRDDIRALTERGREQTRTVYRQALARELASPAILVMSPYRRARQTADIANRLFHPEHTLVAEELTPDQPLPRLVDFIESLVHQIPGDAAVMLVGHQPLLGRLIAWLLDDPAMTVVATSSLTVIECEIVGRGCGTLCWQLSP